MELSIIAVSAVIIVSIILAAVRSMGNRKEYRTKSKFYTSRFQ